MPVSYTHLIVGMANVKDITSIENKEKRARAEKICITAAIDFIKNREAKKCGKCFLNTLKEMCIRDSLCVSQWPESQT